MNNRYIFRGKRKDNGEWIEGNLINCAFFNNDGFPIFYILDTDNIEYDCWEDIAEEINYLEVIPKTVGQCTGLKDKNGKLIFEGDVLKGFTYPFLSDGEYNYYALVVWSKDYCAFRIRTIKAPQSKVRGISDGNTEFMNDWNSDDWEVIGNIHDNPELLEVEK